MLVGGKEICSFGIPCSSSVSLFFSGSLSVLVVLVVVVVVVDEFPFGRGKSVGTAGKKEEEGGLYGGAIVVRSARIKGFV